MYACCKWLSGCVAIIFMCKCHLAVWQAIAEKAKIIFNK